VCGARVRDPDSVVSPPIVALALVGLISACAQRGPVLPTALAPVAQPGAEPGRIELTDVPFFPQQAYQCGPAALATALAYSGLAVRPEQLSPEVYLPGKSGSLQVEMVAAARRYDRIPYAVQPSLSALLAELRAGRPVVVFQNLGIAAIPVWHFAVLVGYSIEDDSVLLRSGKEERRRMSAYNFARTWDLGENWGLVILRPGELPAADDADGYLRAVAAKEAVSGPAGLLEAYRAAVRRWPDHPVARFGYANALRASGNLPAAIGEYRALLLRQPDDPAVLNNLADALNLGGCRAEAAATIERALAVGPPDAPLRAVIEQTRREILSAASAGPEAASCRE